MLLAYLTRGVKAGLVAGLAFGLLVALVANPLVGYADELGHDADDHGGEAAAGHHHATADHHGGTAGGHADGAVSPTLTRVVSVASGVLWGVLLGAVVFGVGFYFLEPAIPGAGATKSYLLAGAGFVAFSGAPWLVLPPRPPGVEAGATVDARLALYGGMMVVGALVCLAAGAAYNRVRDARGRAAAAGAAALPSAALAVPAALAPARQVEGALTADLVAGLTGLVVFGQALLWAVLAAAHARFHRRAGGDDRAGADLAGSDPATVAD